MTLAETTKYTAVRDQIRSGDMFFFRPESWYSPTGHIGMAVWRKSDQCTLCISESREGVGGRTVSLSSQIRKYPGRIDVLTPTDDCPRVLRERAATVAFNWAGHSYAYWRIVAMARRRLVWLQKTFGTAPNIHDMSLSKFEEAKVCSEMFTWAYRWAKRELVRAAQLIKDCFWDALPGIGDKWAEPIPLAVGNPSFKVLAKGLVL